MGSVIYSELTVSSMRLARLHESTLLLSHNHNGAKPVRRVTTAAGLACLNSRKLGCAVEATAVFQRASRFDKSIA